VLYSHRCPRVAYGKTEREGEKKHGPNARATEEKAEAQYLRSIPGHAPHVQAGCPREASGARQGGPHVHPGDIQEYVQGLALVRQLPTDRQGAAAGVKQDGARGSDTAPGPGRPGVKNQ
jgi:hypothetical protein